MISSNLGAGYALVPVAPDDNPDHGGGPIRKSPNNALPAHAGNYVYRTPHLVVREAEAGANWPYDLTQQMFLPDGRLVPAKPYAFDMMNGAEPVVVRMPGAAASALRTLVPAVAMFAGAGVGYKTASKHQAWGAIGGAVVGGILGLLFR
jgi:hypothetical protein